MSFETAIIVGRNVFTSEPVAVAVDNNGHVYIVGAVSIVGTVDIDGTVSIADGADVALGTTTDAESITGDATVISLLKRLRTLVGEAGDALGDTTDEESITGDASVVSLLKRVRTMMGDVQREIILEAMLAELRKLNLHMALITDANITDADITEAI